MSFHQNKIFLAIGPLTTEKIRIERSGKSRNLDFRNHEKNRFPDHFHSFLEDGVATFHSFSSPGAQQTTISSDCNKPNSKKYPTHPQSIQNRLSHCFRFVNHSRMTLDEILSKRGERDSEIKHRSLKNCWKTL